MPDPRYDFERVPGAKPKAPYVHQPFPALYYSADGKHKKVHNEAEAKAARAAGWSDKPFPPKEEPVEVDELAALAERVAKLEAKVFRSK